MPTPLTLLPEPLASGPFSTAAARDQGVSAARLRHRRLATPFHGARVLGPAPAPTDMQARALALASVLDRRHIFGGTTALRLCGVDVPARLRHEQTLHLVVVSPGARVRRAGVTCRVVPRYGRVRTLASGLVVTSGPTTFLHLARDLTLEEMIEVGDALTRRRNPVTNLEHLRAHVGGSPPCAGLRTARQALELVVPGTDSMPETTLRRIIERAGLPRPAVNAPAYADGAYLGRPDLSYPDLKIAIEYLGDVHRTDRRTWRIDVERHQRFRDAGWTVHEATGATLVDPRSLLARLRSAHTHLG
ncbi:hypothetical protein [Litorihabitans aurantiacus]|uniref:Transcriptional regulator, AbiEi antitoxin, Type IV TA system n=1 Tax=Litorihabitans aurantiacus TaxID=1930061 RepID=A0AA37UT56_9MICO|nr:hypothetical protein [Litorihabitans aurantiacus]GMA30207.1 hypothetical protein GCM10025875_01990 [Litorihabitans aurantiacus]